MYTGYHEELAEGRMFRALCFMLANNVSGIFDIVLLIKNKFVGIHDNAEVKGQGNQHDKVDPDMLPAQRTIYKIFQ